MAFITHCKHSLPSMPHPSKPLSTGVEGMVLPDGTLWRYHRRGGGGEVQRAALVSICLRPAPG